MSSSSRLTCAYLSCKVDEFNVSSTQFVGNLIQETPAGQERIVEQILEYELLLIQQLHFHLVVHNPYRPLEGLLIDLKVTRPHKYLTMSLWNPHIVMMLIYQTNYELLVKIRQDIPCWRIQSHWGRAQMTFWHRQPWQMQGCSLLHHRLHWQLFWTVLQEQGSVWKGETLRLQPKGSIFYSF